MTGRRRSAPSHSPDGGYPDTAPDGRLTGSEPLTGEVAVILSLRRTVAATAVGLLASGVVALTAPGTASAAPSAAAAPAALPKVNNPTLKERLANRNRALELPTLSSLCQQFIGRPNPYRDPAPNVNQIVGDPIVQAGTQQGCNTAQNETHIAVNPYNPRNIVAGANDYRFFNTRTGRNDSGGVAYTSFDGGRTWRNIILPRTSLMTGATGALSIMDLTGDPVLAFGPRNTVYYVNLVAQRNLPFGDAASGIVVNISRDGGLTWSDPEILAVDGVDSNGNQAPTDVFNDKPWIAADRFSGTVYVTWTEFVFTAAGYQESPIVLRGSRDFGRTWSEQTRVSPSRAQGFAGGEAPFAQGSNPAVDRDGTLYVAYETTYCSANCAEQVDYTVVATSKDRGRTYTKAQVDVNYNFPFNPDTGSLGLTGENFRINSYPQLAYDPVFDRLYVTWADDRNGQYDAAGNSVRTNGDNIVSTSTNGRTWSGPTVVGTPQDEVFGAVTTLAGFVVVASYTRAYDPGGVDLDFAYWKSFGPGGLGRAPIRRGTTQSSDPRIQFVAQGLVSGQELQGVFIGDYNAVAFGPDLRFHLSWTDFRGRPGTTPPNQDAYTQAVSVRG